MTTFYRVARWVFTLSVTAMLTIGGMLIIVNSDFFLIRNMVPMVDDKIGPVLVLLLGFLVIVSSLCGALRKEAWQ